MRATGTIFIPVMILIRHISGNAGLFLTAYVPKYSAMSADIAVTRFDVGHVFTTAALFFEAAFLPFLISLWLYVRDPFLFFQPQIILFILVASICGYGFMLFPVDFRYLFLQLLLHSGFVFTYGFLPFNWA